jgi:uncharacterized protein YehS (DUF1456 family)
MILLKIQDKGMMVDIPGTKKVRSPVEIDITKIDINFVTMYLRKQGIENYRIVSDIDKGVKEVLPTGNITLKKKKDDGWKDNIESRFGRLESLIINFLGKKESKPTVNSEQITNKLKKLEKLSEEIIRKQTLGIPISKEDDGPKIEELDDTFIPEIDIEGMTMKGSTIKTLQSDSEDADEAADLLSSIVKNGG